MSAASMDLKHSIALQIGCLDASDVYLYIDVARRFGVSRSTVVRWHQSGVFVGNVFVKGSVSHVYFTRQQCEVFEQSDDFLQLVAPLEKSYSRIAATVHDFFGNDVVVYTMAEMAEKMGCSVSTIRRYDSSGEFVAQDLMLNGRKYKYYTDGQYQAFLVSGARGIAKVQNSDLLDTTIGKLTVKSFTEASVRSGQYGSYVCECTCGNIVEIPRSELLSGKKKSCGCKFRDLTGMQFVRWHVDSLAPCHYTPGGFKIFQYNCTCACGTKRIVTARSLTSGASQSCGCLHKDVVSNLFLTDLTDKRFGALVAKTHVGLKWSPSGKSGKSIWHCVCDCGNELDVSAVNLVNGRIDSCGCISPGPYSGASKYEMHVRAYLETLGLFDGNGYVQFKTFPDLFGVGGWYLSYDFYIENWKGHAWLIECQGEQHYRPAKWFGGDAQFEKQQEHDRRKREYASKIGVPLIEIPYTMVAYDDVVSLLRNFGF